MSLDANPLNVGALAAIVAGPVLRRLTRTKVSVWVALTRATNVSLAVRVAGQPATEIVSAPTTPVRVGTNLWMATVTADAPGGAGGTFAAGQLYEYRLTSTGWPQPNWSDVSIGTAQPAFPGPPASVADMKVLHTSCRKVHGGGRDGLALAADMIMARVTANMPNARPHLLVLSGDQIYADEVPAPLMPRIRRIATDLVDIDETALFGPLPAFAGRQARTESFGLTSSAASDHLWTLGEFLATYLLYWSPELWPAALPQWAEVTPATDLDPASGLDQTKWDALLAAIAPFRAGLANVRKVLATVPSIMVLDDHEVTDDWNLNHPWAQAVYANARGSRIVANGLIAYALCQHWGNRPDRFASAGSAEANLLAAVSFTGASPDTPAVRDLLGVPTAAPPNPPSVVRDLTAMNTIRWDFTIGAAEGWPVRVIALDERTAREFIRVDHPAARISMAALGLMLPGPAAGAPEAATFVIAPSPILGTHVIEHVLQPAMSLFPGGSVYADFESWPAATPNHQELLRLLAAYTPLILLSGDVHYSATAALVYTRGPVNATAAQLTSSGARNADTKTMLLHLLGDFATKVGIERERSTTGFNALSNAQRAQLASPPAAGSALPYDDMVDVMLGRVFRDGQSSPVIMATEVATAYALGAGDWHYTVAPIDDETLPPAGSLLNDLNAAPAVWAGWDAAKSWTMVKALRASDLHRIGRVIVGLPQISLIELTTGPLTVHHHLTAAVGDRAVDTGSHVCNTSVVID